MIFPWLTRPEYYILRGREPVPVSLLVWARWFERSPERMIAKTQVGDARVSTVFLGLDHSFGGGPPQIFETMIFGGPADGEMWRCATYDEAEDQHCTAIEKARG